MSDLQKKMSLNKWFDNARIKQIYEKTKQKSTQGERDAEKETNNRSVESKERNSIYRIEGDQWDCKENIRLKITMTLGFC